MAKAEGVSFGHYRELCLVTYFFSSNRRFDLDNAHKLVADALQKGGVFENDRQIVAGAYAWYTGKPHTLIGVCEWHDEDGDVFKLLHADPPEGSSPLAA